MSGLLAFRCNCFEESINFTTDNLKKKTEGINISHFNIVMEY